MRHWVCCLLLIGCVPKYNQLNEKLDSDFLPKAKEPPQKVTAVSPTQPLSKQTLRLYSKDSLVWDTALDILLKDYALQIVDQTNGIIVTEWDTYYLDSKLYRNKISIRVKKAGWSATDVTISNKVQAYVDGLGANNLGATWVPGQDIIKEESRIMNGLSMLLTNPQNPAVEPK